MLCRSQKDQYHIWTVELAKIVESWIKAYRVFSFILVGYEFVDFASYSYNVPENATIIYLRQANKLRLIHL